MKSVDLNSPDFQLDPALDNYAVMGNPVAHSKSPDIHRIFASQTGQSISYQAILVPPGEFDAALAAFQHQGGKGLNITVPYKGSAWKAATTRSARAELAGAVNTVSFSADGDILGDNTDGVGLLRDLQQNHIAIRGKRILILGAGGAVRGVLGPVLGQAPVAILVANRTLARAERLLSIFADYPQLQSCQLDELDAVGSFDLVINGTSSGLTGDLPDLPGTVLHGASCCYDMVYADTDTAFVRWAKQQGISKALDGLGMLVEQAAESFYIWRGVRPDTAPVIKMLRNAKIG